MYVTLKVAGKLVGSAITKLPLLSVTVPTDVFSQKTFAPIIGVILSSDNTFPFKFCE